MKDKTLLLIAPGREYLLPYFEREFSESTVVSDPEAAHDYAVAVCAPGEPYPADPATMPVLVCPNIVGTGMTGMPMEMVRRIMRLRHFHIAGNEARMSTVHAIDVAHAARLAIGSPGAHIVTDLEDPTYQDFAEALAFRLGDRRIYTISSKWAPWLMSREWIDKVTVNAMCDGSEFASKFGFTPTPVTQYLRTHVYDESSL